MARLIDADALREELDSVLNWNTNDEYNMYSDTVVAIDNAPTVDAEPVRHGHWSCDEDAGWAQCSLCGYYFDISDDPPSKYCGGCGAKMEEKE